MQPGRPFLRSLHAAFLRHFKGKVHCEPGVSSLGGARDRRGVADQFEAYRRHLERSDITDHVLTAVKACPNVDSAKVTVFASFEEDLALERGDVVVLVLALVQKYALDISYVEARKMASCSELIDYIESQLCAQ